MKTTDDEKNSNVVRLGGFKRKSGLEHLASRKREVEVAPTEFREFREWEKLREEATSDDIIGGMLSEFDVESSVTEQSLPSIPMPIINDPSFNHESHLEDILNGLDGQLGRMRQDISRVRVFIDEIKSGLHLD